MVWEIETDIEVAATPDVVWDVLTDFESYPEWNPTMPKVRGEPELGSHLRVRVNVPRGPTLPMRPTIIVFDPGRELRWRSTVGSGGLVEVAHSFVVDDDGDTVRFVQRPRIEGTLAVRLMGRYGYSARRTVEEMNLALADRAETVDHD